jgi:BirA family biotin operon repressor/biotin-[acetyl-CoA-carboxylase] ligase
VAGEPLTPTGWQLRQLPVCGSSEDELDAWLAELGPDAQTALQGSSLAVVAQQQLQGRGQRGRTWQSPPGGLWLSAAMAWPAGTTSVGGGAPLTLAAAVGLALQLETLGLAPRIKWPNDLLLEGRKLAGLLARLRLAGERVRWAQVGVGLNGTNPVPAGAIGLAAVLPPHQATPDALLPLVLAGLDWARSQAQNGQGVLLLANQRLHRPAQGVLHQGQWCQVDGLGPQGSLLVRCGAQQLALRQLEPGDNLSPENRA